MKIDLHTHTNRYSMCSNLAPGELIELEREAGIDAVVLTDHNTFWPESEIEELRSEFPKMKIFNGAEVTVNSLHHVVTFLPSPDKAITDLNDPSRFVQQIRDRNGYMIAAHPFRFFEDYGERNSAFELDGVEVASRGMKRIEQIEDSRQLAKEWGALPVASSDAHSPSPVGQFFTEIDQSVTSEIELIDSLKRTTSNPVYETVD